MTYKLARKLKDAGFSEGLDRPNAWVDTTNFLWDGYQSDGRSLAYIPTLSELIEACGHP